MTYRARLLTAMLLAVIVPAAILAFLIRDEMGGRLTAQYVLRAETRIAEIETELRQEQNRIKYGLAAISTAIADDNRLRRAAVDAFPGERPYLLDYAGNAMPLTGLDMLQIQDDRGRILSSGHFRNEYDRIDTTLPRLLPGDKPAFARVRAPEGPFIVLAAADSIELGGRFFYLTGGRTIDEILPEPAEDTGELAVRLVLSEAGIEDTSITGPTRDADLSGRIVRQLQLPFVDAQRDTVSTATLQIGHDLSGLEVLRASVDRWFLIVVIATGVIAAILAFWLASRISRPIAELAQRASRIDLDRLNVVFKTDREDEIGALSRVLRSMMDRLRVSAAAVRDAERRATRGELARQVNHDIKNGLAPVRNVFRHLSEVAREDPGDLPAVFRERETTLESGITYLENLAANYARLYPTVESRPTDVNELILRVASDFAAAGARNLETRARGAATVLADPVSLRRILDNLVSNAVDSTAAGNGSVLVSSEHTRSDDGRPAIRIVVEDTGEGMTEEEVSRAFQDFYTTKDRGTGLGLSIVRRLVMDLDGSMRVESRKGEGSRFIVDLPELTEKR